jgi:hypothetical protein
LLYSFFNRAAKHKVKRLNYRTVMAKKSIGEKEKILIRQQRFPAYAHKPRQSPSISLATISAITGSLAGLKPFEKPYLLDNGLGMGTGGATGREGGCDSGIAGPAGPFRRPEVIRRCSDIMSSARSKRGISALLTLSPLPAGPAEPGIMSFARRISGLRGGLEPLVCMSFSAIRYLSRSYQFIHFNTKGSIIQAGKA